MQEHLILTTIQLAGNLLYINFGHLLVQYFKNMIYMLDTIDRFNFDKQYYSELFRAQLSRKEILIYLFNFISSKSSIENVELLIKYQILDDIFFMDLFFIHFGNYWVEKEKEFIKNILLCFIDDERQKLANEH